MARYTREEREGIGRVWLQAFGSYRNAKPRFVNNNQVVEDGRAFGLAERDFVAQSVMLGDAYLDEMKEAAEVYLRGARIQGIATLVFSGVIAVATVVYSTAFVWSLYHPVSSVVRVERVLKSVGQDG